LLYRGAGDSEAQVESIRSIVWIGSEHLAAELAARSPKLELVWECDAERALDLPLNDFDAVLLACDGPDHAFDQLSILAGGRPLPPILVMLEASDGSTDQEILACGATDVFSRSGAAPSDRERNELLSRLGALKRDPEASVSPRRSSPPVSLASEIVGDSPQMAEVFSLIGHASRSRVTVLITGETGTGKELLAQTIHRRSSRHRSRFVAVNCAAFPEALLESELFGHKRGSFTGADRDKAGLFEVANRGTLFLDEIAETTGPFQAKLLRVLQEREVRPIGSSQTRPIDVRVIAATNRNLLHEAGSSRFRADLYYRLAVFPIHVPPLRERPLDILSLAEHFLALHAARDGHSKATLSSEASRLLQSYGWPGNVRELENEIQRALAISDPDEPLTPAYFSDRLSGILEPVEAVVQPGETLRETMGRIEAWLIRRALETNQGRRAITARGLGITREGLYKKMKRHGIA
jgi:transcriptional regulator with PAS, ATPase and Fis domain